VYITAVKNSLKKHCDFR